jgi:transcription elongation factor GreA
MEKIYELTQEGFDEYQAELDHLVNIDRPNNLEALKEARAQGDLSENADYDSARQRQAEIESRITELEDILRNSEIIKADVSDKVSLGKTVLIKVNGKEREIKLVNSLEANPILGKLSVDSPIGKGILGSEAGDKISMVSETNRPIEIEVIKLIFN